MSGAAHRRASACIGGFNQLRLFHFSFINHPSRNRLSELDPERELQYARVRVDRCDPPKGVAPDTVVRDRELRPVEEVEELRAEDEARRLPETQWERARDRQVRVLEARSAQDVATQGTVGSGSRLRNGIGVEVAAICSPRLRPSPRLRLPTRSACGVPAPAARSPELEIPNGRPDCSVTIPLICHPPSAALTVREPRARPALGTSQTKDAASRCGWSLSATPRVKKKLNGFGIRLSRTLSFHELWSMFLDHV